MNSKLLYRYWDSIKKYLKQDFFELDEKDLNYIYGDEEKLIENIMNKTGQSKEEVLYLIYIYINNIRSGKEE